jgi:APA family basic amino acid/polyamine antiporter
MVLILVIVAFLHHGSATADDSALFYFSLGFAALHLLIYGAKMSKRPVN